MTTRGATRKRGMGDGKATLDAQTYCQRTPVSKRRRGFAKIRSSVGVYLCDQTMSAAGMYDDFPPLGPWEIREAYRFVETAIVPMSWRRRSARCDHQESPRRRCCSCVLMILESPKDDKAAFEGGVIIQKNPLYSGFLGRWLGEIPKTMKRAAGVSGHAHHLRKKVEKSFDR